jgi:hypothetical protein
MKTEMVLETLADWLCNDWRGCWSEETLLKLMLLPRENTILFRITGILYCDASVGKQTPDLLISLSIRSTDYFILLLVIPVTITLSQNVSTFKTQVFYKSLNKPSQCSYWINYLAFHFSILTAMHVNRLLRRIFWLKRQEVTGSRGKDIMSSLLNCIPLKTLFGWTNREEWDGRGI